MPYTILLIKLTLYLWVYCNFILNSHFDDTALKNVFVFIISRNWCHKYLFVYCILVQRTHVLIFNEVNEINTSLPSRIEKILVFFYRNMFSSVYRNYNNLRNKFITNTIMANLQGVYITFFRIKNCNFLNSVFFLRNLLIL